MNLPRDIPLPRIFSIPTRIVRGKTSIPGIIQDIVPNAAKKNPSKMTGIDRGKGPIGVLPDAII